MQEIVLRVLMFLIWSILHIRNHLINVILLVQMIVSLYTKKIHLDYSLYFSS